MESTHKGLSFNTRENFNMADASLQTGDTVSFSQRTGPGGGESE